MQNQIGVKNQIGVRSPILTNVPGWLAGVACSSCRWLGAGPSGSLPARSPLGPSHLPSPPTPSVASAPRDDPSTTPLPSPSLHGHPEIVPTFHHAPAPQRLQSPPTAPAPAT